MHFWIDKRAGQLHSYGGGGRGRVPGAGGFYSRTFGNRHHHPPPLLRASSNSSNPSHSSNSGSSTNPNPPTTTTTTINNPAIGIGIGPSSNNSSTSGGSHSQSQSSHFSRSVQMSAPPNTNNQSQSQSEAIANHFEMLRNHLRFHDPSGFINPNHPHNNNACHHHHPSIPINSYMARGDPAAAAVFGSGGGVGAFGHLPPTGSDPVIGLSAAGGGGGYVGVGIPMPRRPRSHSHSAAGSAAPNRRRSSSSSSGSINGQQRRASMNRWTYDPYHINQHNRSHASQQPWHDLRQQMSSQNPPINEASPLDLSQMHIQMSQMSQQNHNHPQQNQPRRLIGLDSNSSHSHWRDDDPSGSSMPQGTSTSTSEHSIADPAWARTKRIGLTLCFMAFILLSTVAAKFIIEGPLLLDKQPRQERTEATIYFFLTELIFVVFAMALFFTGVTCLRKRTNQYLLRQFNQYIMQTSPQGTGTISPEYYPGGAGNHLNSSVPHRPHSPSQQGQSMSMGMNQGAPFQHHHHHHFLPSLENHLMNMHITVAESSAANFAMAGLAKPPPYHIALYLPVPDEQVMAVKEDEENITPKRRNSQGENDHRQSQSSSWISSCLAENETDKTGDDESSTEETEPDRGDPRRKRQRKSKKDEDSTSRSETPPPPYGQL